MAMISTIGGAAAAATAPANSVTPAPASEREDEFLRVIMA